MKNRNVSSSPYSREVKKKKQKILKTKVIIFILIFFSVLVGLGLTSRWEKINIENIEIKGNSATDSEMLEEVAKEQITGYYLWFFPKTNILLYPKGEIKRKLADNFKILKDISLKVESSRTLKITLSEREGEYTWCGGDLPAKDSKSENVKCYFMDAIGYIFDEAPYFSNDVYFKFFGVVAQNSEMTPPLGFYFFPDIFPILLSLRESMEKIGIKTSSLLMKNDGGGELHLSSNLSFVEGPKIIFKMDSNFEKITENLQAALTTEPLQSDFKNKYSSLQYIDLRFGNKVYYKFK